MFSPAHTFSLGPGIVHWSMVSSMSFVSSQPWKRGDHLFCRLEVGTFWSKPQNLSVFASSVIASQTDFKCQVWITLCSVDTCCPQRSTLS